MTGMTKMTRKMGITRMAGVTKNDWEDWDD